MVLAHGSALAGMNERIRPQTLGWPGASLDFGFWMFAWRFSCSGKLPDRHKDSMPAVFGVLDFGYGVWSLGFAVWVWILGFWALGSVHVRGIPCKGPSPPHKRFVAFSMKDQPVCFVVLPCVPCERPAGPTRAPRWSTPARRHPHSRYALLSFSMKNKKA